MASLSRWEINRINTSSDVSRLARPRYGPASSDGLRVVRMKPLPCAAPFDLIASINCKEFLALTARRKSA